MKMKKKIGTVMGIFAFLIMITLIGFLYTTQESQFKIYLNEIEVDEMFACDSWEYEHKEDCMDSFNYRDFYEDLSPSLKGFYKSKQDLTTEWLDENCFVLLTPTHYRTNMTEQQKKLVGDLTEDTNKKFIYKCGDYIVERIK